MNRKKLVMMMSIGVTLALCLSAGSATAQNLGTETAGPQQGTLEHGLLAPPGPTIVNSRINYQGVLREGDPPALVTGSRDMAFHLYSSPSCGSLLDTITKPGVEVENGLFNVALNVTHGDFDGQGLSLRVEMGGAIMPCREVVPVPYALSLRPGATIGDADSTVRLNYDRTVGSPPFQISYIYGVHAVVAGGYTFSHGLYGEASGPTGYTYGVYGKSASTSGAGVGGHASAGSGETYGVLGQSDSTAGAGVYARGVDTGADLILGGNASTGAGDDGRIFSDPAYSSSDIVLVSNDGIRIDLDQDGNGEDADFEIRDKDNALIFNVDNDGRTDVDVLRINGGSDLAEPFEIAGSESIEPGTVVAIDPSHPGQLRVADGAYDRTVAGCISGGNGINPGLTMQQEGTIADGSVPVALSGRVYCWADATYGPIQPGDLLTTSDTPGHAMRASEYERAQGAMIGKAMSALDEGRGLVLVLVTLQ